MPPTYLPLRWESTGDQWWFASPIDWAAANGHYDLVRELLHIDINLLIKLTSLRRIRRLETMWDDEDSSRSNDVAKWRSHVAHKLLQECETKKGYNSLIRAGYGGWLLYTAASAGDIMFVKQMLDRDPLLVFGEGEYGITDMLYAAARSRSSEVFRMLLDCAVSPKKDVSSVFKWEMINRAAHAAARGGHIDMLRELLDDLCDILSYRDGQGFTLLHSASSRGQVEVVQYLLSSYHNAACAVDNQGNTALHVAAHQSQLRVVESLISASPSCTSLTNNYGDNFLHMAITGFTMRSFRRLDKQMELMKQLVAGKIVNVESFINAANNDGTTVLHMAVTASNQSDLMDLLLSIHCIDLNPRDAQGRTPLDLLKQCPQSASSELLIKQLISAGGICTSSCEAVLHERKHGIGVSPGTSFRIPDGEVILHADVHEYYMSATEKKGETEKKRVLSSPMRRRLEVFLSWTGKERNVESCYKISSSNNNNDNNSINSAVSLRQQFSRTASNKQVLSLQGSRVPRPSTAHVVANSNQGSPLNVCSWASPVDPMEPIPSRTRQKQYSFDQLRNLFMLRG